MTLPGLGDEPILELDLTPEPAPPNTSGTVPATLLPGLPAIPDVLPGTPVADAEINLPVLECDLGLALLAVSADCNLGILGPLLQPMLMPVLMPLADLPPILGVDLDAVANLATGLVDADAAIDTEGGLGDPDGITGDVCLDVAVLSPTPGVCPAAVLPDGGVPAGAAPSVIDADVCAGISVLAPIPGVCPEGRTGGPGGQLIDVDACAGVAVLGGVVPAACTASDTPGGLIDVDVCATLALLGLADTAACVGVQTDPPGTTPTTTVPGGPDTTVPGGSTPPTTIVGPGTTTPGGDDTDDPDGPGGPGGPGGDDTGSGGPGQRPSVNEPGGELPMTGIAIAGTTLVIAAALVVTGAGTRLLARVPGRRGA